MPYAECGKAGNIDMRDAVTMRPSTTERHVDNVSDDSWHEAMSTFADVHYEQTAIFSAGQRGERISHMLLTRAASPLGGARVGLYLVPGLARGMALVRFAPFWRSVNAASGPEFYTRFAEQNSALGSVRDHPQPKIRATEKETAMKTRTIVTAALTLSLGLLSAIAFAQAAMVKGEVKKIDEQAGKITLKHGPIKDLGMDEDGMTMVFRVKDPAMLKQVKAGDKVQFEVERATAGITITAIKKAK